MDKPYDYDALSNEEKAAFIRKDRRLTQNIQTFKAQGITNIQDRDKILKSLSASEKLKFYRISNGIEPDVWSLI